MSRVQQQHERAGKTQSWPGDQRVRYAVATSLDGYIAHEATKLKLKAEKIYKTGIALLDNGIAQYLQHSLVVDAGSVSSHRAELWATCERKPEVTPT